MRGDERFGEGTWGAGGGVENARIRVATTRWCGCVVTGISRGRRRRELSIHTNAPFPAPGVWGSRNNGKADRIGSLCSLFEN